MTETRRPKILLIDDDQVVLMTTQALLRAEGYDVSTHNSGFGGVSVIEKNRPDLVLLDVNMPGLSGRGLVDAIRGEERLADTRIFFFSSEDDLSLQNFVRDAGIDGFIRKGDRDQLREKVASALHA